MYGATNDIMSKLEKQIKEKIYKEMLQEYQRYKQNTQKQSLQIQNVSKRYQTQSQQQNQQVDNDENHDNNNQSQCFSFLPAIKTKRKDTTINQSSDDHLNYMNPRKKVHELSFSRQSRRHRGTVANRKEIQQFSDSDEEKTHLYLNQCEQIINNLKDISLKQSRKIPGRKNKYINDKKGFQKLEKPTYAVATLPKKQKQLSYNEIPKTNDLQKRSSSSIFFQNFKKKIDNKDFSNFGTKMEIREKQNVYTISPPQGLIKENEQKEQQLLETSSTKKQDKLKQNKNKKADQNQNQKKQSRINEENKQKVNKKNDKNGQQKNQQNDKKTKKEDLPAEDDPQQEAKKQRAIVKYLKKAKLRGQQLQQKVEAFKKQNSNEVNENPNPET